MMLRCMRMVHLLCCRNWSKVSGWLVSVPVGGCKRCLLAHQHLQGGVALSPLTLHSAAHHAQGLSLVLWLTQMQKA